MKETLSSSERGGVQCATGLMVLSSLPNPRKAVDAILKYQLLKSSDLLKSWLKCHLLWEAFPDSPKYKLQL